MKSLENGNSIEQIQSFFICSEFIQHLSKWFACAAETHYWTISFKSSTAWLWVVSTVLSLIQNILAHRLTACGKIQNILITTIHWCIVSLNPYRPDNTHTLRFLEEFVWRCINIICLRFGDQLWLEGRDILLLLLLTRLLSTISQITPGTIVM